MRDWQRRPLCLCLMESKSSTDCIVRYARFTFPWICTPKFRLDRNHRDHMEALPSHDDGILEIVAVNLDYSDDGSPNVDLIDFDAEALLKAAALNSKDVLAVVSPSDYPAVIQFSRRVRFEGYGAYI
ncbi:bifunctional purine biosynthesis protein PurH-like [Zingiber officinale]|uniref:Uncharacterized protein n=1 Tax=Zingiber officinale TaxID=94328 RepID=A0A8J5KQY0_ZINOF|nr:bifunctional purine biosynthesis protein PurH-like [Zingiber officinale]XP_042414527.1 bifunctional purine biosynthesis protein PurH-like [Zingiber officinale]KAG6488552.1 hypothetical protein ZIOFF_049798 [Zingiber officinale]